MTKWKNKEQRGRQHVHAKKSRSRIESQKWTEVWQIYRVIPFHFAAVGMRGHPCVSRRRLDVLVTRFVVRFSLFYATDVPMTRKEPWLRATRFGTLFNVFNVGKRLLCTRKKNYYKKKKKTLINFTALLRRRSYESSDNVRRLSFVKSAGTRAYILFIFSNI